MMRHSAPPSATTGLKRRWLPLIQVGWIALAGLCISVFLASLPAAETHGEILCRAATCASDQLTPAAVQHLDALGLSVALFAWYIVVLKCLVMLVFGVVGFVVFRRMAADRTALVAAFTFVTFPLTFTHAASTVPALLWLPAQMLDILGSMGMSLLFFIFPSGRFAPRWTALLWAGSQIGYLAQIAFPRSPFALLLGQAPLLGLVASLVAVQVYRYVRVSTRMERQQTKWVVLGVAAGFVGFLLTISLYIGFPNFASQATLLYLINSGVTYLAPLLIPLSFSLAILRYRLWEVDVLISKVLLYALLTGLLGGLYAGLIIGLESLAGLLTGQASPNPAVLVLATLAIAALFQPVRIRLQRAIDQRFYRSRLDAAKALQAFGATLRQETDLDHLHAHLLTVVAETMQPAHASLWLLPLADTPRPVSARPRPEQRSQPAIHPAG